MSLKTYLGEESIELLKRKIESFTGIQLQSFPWWLINKDRLRQKQETGKRRLIIVITVKKEAEAKKLYASGLRFGSVIKVVEKYWDIESGLVYMICYSIRHQQIESCGDRPQKYIIYAGPNKIKDYQCGIAEYQKRKKKICVYITSKCANSIEAHTTDFYAVYQDIWRR